MPTLLDIPKSERTPDIIRNCLFKNGVEIRLLDEDEITLEYVEIAVMENGFVYSKLNSKYKAKPILELAIRSTKGMVVSECMSGQNFDEDLQYMIVDYGYSYLYNIGNLSQNVFDYTFKKNYNQIMHDFVNARYEEYSNYKKRFLTHKHIVYYFHKHSHYVSGNYIKRLHDMTDNVTIKLLLDIYEAAPNNYDFLKTVEGFDTALRKSIIDNVIEELN